MFNKFRKYLHNKTENVIFSVIIIIGLISFVVDLMDFHSEKEYKLTCYNTANQVILQYDTVGKPEIKNNQISLTPVGEEEIQYIFIDNIYSCKINKNE